jgi:hypothetical protein
MEKKEKTEMTIENVQALWQTLDDIVGRKYNVKIQAIVERKK